MLTRRIIPCLDILNGRVVKGKRFENLQDAGDPIELASHYSQEGADEVVILDISATLEERRPFFEIVRRVAENVNIPLTVGGGIRTLEDIVELLHSGADKVALNTALVEKPFLLAQSADLVGSQALVAAIDAKRSDSHWTVHIKSGSLITGIDVLTWAKEVIDRGAGELLVTSIDSDGMKGGYDCDLLRSLTSLVRVPVVASGGAGTMQHMADALQIGNADAVLAASIFHFNEISIKDLKQFLRSRDIPVRI